MEFFKSLKTGFLLVLCFTILTGIIYPAVVTLIAQTCFNWRANGSLIVHHNHVLGSELIGQEFIEPKYFWGRPSATLPFPYNPMASSGSNLSATNPMLLTHIKNRINQLKVVDDKNKLLIPVDLVTASASGLDPEISPLSAQYQVTRVATARQVSVEKISELVKNSIHKNVLLGEPTVNVLELNIALDNITEP